MENINQGNFFFNFLQIFHIPGYICCVILYLYFKVFKDFGCCEPNYIRYIRDCYNPMALYLVIFFFKYISEFIAYLVIIADIIRNNSEKKILYFILF